MWRVVDITWYLCLKLDINTLLTSTDLLVMGSVVDLGGL